MKLLVFGASGGCGSWVVKLAAEREWSVTAFVREQTAYVPPAGVKLMRGDVLNAAHVTSVMPDHDAILSCVGAQRINAVNPWSVLKSPPDFCANSAARIIAGAAATGIRRIGGISAAGVGDSAAALPLVMRALIARSTIGVMYRDLGRMEDAYDASGLDWFAVRPVTLINLQPSTRVRVLQRFGSFSVISRADVAQWMLSTIAAPAQPQQRRPVIGWW
jgi:uncharacterized protein YbjT (DUF2867 family)